MPNNNELIEKVVDQSSGVLEKVYDDLAHPTAKSIGNTLSLIPRTVGVWLGKWEKWVINGEESIRLTAKAVAEKSANIPEEKLTEPEPYVAVPAIQQLSYCYNCEELRELYANLLVSSMNVDKKDQVHPSFVDIIKQLSPLDAKAIEKIRQVNTLIPIVTMRLDFVESSTFHELLYNYSIDLLPVYGDDKIMCSSLENLDRLGIISVRYDQSVKPDEVYDVFKEDDMYKDFKRQHESDKAKITLKKGLIELTSFGTSFCNVCCD